jgi:hypothetical protein
MRRLRLLLELPSSQFLVPGRGRAVAFLQLGRHFGSDQAEKAQQEGTNLFLALF